MDLSLRFPVFVIASDNGFVVVKSDEKDCIMLFHSKELADLQIKKISPSHRSLGPLHSLTVTNAALLAEGLQELPPDVTCAVWDPTGTPAGFVHVAVDELLRLASGR